MHFQWLGHSNGWDEEYSLPVPEDPLAQPNEPWFKPDRRMAVYVCRFRF